MTREDEARELLAVTQADREAAAEMLERMNVHAWEKSVGHIRAGNADAGYSVQAFAKHRLASTRSSSPASGEVERDMCGETVLGMRVAAYRETHPEHGDKYGHSYSEHWSTPSKHPNVKVERLFTEQQVRDLLASLPTARADIGEDAAQHFKVGDRVTKVKGLPFGNGDARVVAVYSAEGGSRVVVQHPEGWQHIFAPDQLALASLQSSGRDAGEGM